MRGEVDTIAAALELYLNAHPEAADTLDNIGHWWFTACSSGIDREALTLAVERLVEGGRLSKHEGADGSVTYRAV